MKAANLLISNTGSLRIADFGLMPAFNASIILPSMATHEARVAQTSWVAPWSKAVWSEAYMGHWVSFLFFILDGLQKHHRAGLRRVDSRHDLGDETVAGGDPYSDSERHRGETNDNDSTTNAEWKYQAKGKRDELGGVEDGQER
ncbi:hypothetical protein J3R82DRAFT_2984 [Butyriboletus roseoflavus]|nr:hypothetical protein J3R82DRAFT_2984 [Butyriboletus roseoflavus]